MYRSGGVRMKAAAGNAGKKSKVDKVAESTTVDGPTVGQLITRLLPRGSRAKGKRSHDKFPVWPPDLFAVAASLVEHSGRYASCIYQPWGTDGFAPEYVKRVRKLGSEWSDAEDEIPRSVEHHVQELWNEIWSARDELVISGRHGTDWHNAAIEIMAIADEASAGIGFTTDTLIARRFMWLHAGSIFEKTSAGRASTARTGTACDLVPPGEVRVHPKTNAPPVGCTIRSLSHNLAIVRPEIDSRWHLLPWTTEQDPNDRPLNLLLIPYPYRIDAKAFSGTRTDGQNARSPWGRFDIEPTWLRQNGMTPSKLVDCIVDLVFESEKHVSTIHGVILPELSVTRDVGIQIASALRKYRGLEFFICGTTQQAKRGQSSINSVLNVLYREGEIASWWDQKKHHRWKISSGEVQRYGLGFELNASADWWENIDVANREVAFYVFRNGASMASLVCEDLARIDPVQPVLRAVWGPNLVVALLMDGPQLRGRWARSLRDGLGRRSWLGGSDAYLPGYGATVRPRRRQKIEECCVMEGRVR